MCVRERGGGGVGGWGEDDKTERSKRADSHAHYISQKDNLHFESILC